MSSHFPGSGCVLNPALLDEERRLSSHLVLQNESGCPQLRLRVEGGSPQLWFALFFQVLSSFVSVRTGSWSFLRYALLGWRTSILYFLLVRGGSALSLALLLVEGLS